MKRLTAQCIQHFHYLSEPCLHPEGTKSVFVETVASEPSGYFISRIVEIDHETQERKPLTKVYEQASSDTLISEFLPQYSPNGQFLSYLCNASGDNQIYLKDLSTGETAQVTHLRHGVNTYEWSPSGQMITFEAPLWASEMIEDRWCTEMTPDERVKFENDKARKPLEITCIDYKKDEAFGVLDGHITQIGVLIWEENFENGSMHALVPPSQTCLITRGQMKCTMPTFSPDGQILYFYGQPHKGPFASRKEVFCVRREDLKWGNPQQVLTPEGVLLNPNTPVVGALDNTCVYVPAYQMFEHGGFAENIIVLGLQEDKQSSQSHETKGEKFLLPMRQEATTLGVYGEPISRTTYGKASPYFRIIDQVLYFTNIWRGYQNLYCMKLDGQEKIEALIENDVNVQAFSIVKSDRGLGVQAGDVRISLIGGKLDQVGALYTGHIHKEANHTHTPLKLEHLYDANCWMDDYAIAQTDILWVETKDKKEKIQVWVVHPIDEKEGQKYPAVLDIHGGPECAYSSDFWHEFQAIAANDMFCVYTNPRGSLGYGPDFMAGDACWGEMAFDDLIKAVEVANENYPIDPEKWGVTGGSYGGYMTNKLIMKTDIFAAAVTQRSLVNTATSYGTGDIGFISAREKDLTYVRMLDFLTARARSTLLKDVDQIKTPLCILHAYQDYRCSFEQSEQLFISMKERHPEVPVRLVMFKGENHGITRIGKCHNQMRHLKELTDWFQKYLNEEADVCKVQ